VGDFCYGGHVLLALQVTDLNESVSGHCSEKWRLFVLPKRFFKYRYIFGQTSILRSCPRSESKYQAWMILNYKVRHISLQIGHWTT